ncbi:uncharacterized protein LOC104904709 isoform X4 [Beta vulgaris subsp. vulgaris]|uniref:uncharacterized protein LOC104904709 isoform X4 n=1 Tax=Beta vulgaris subsp. vulgaris TaxID=3555 RepID=UPI0025480EF5|nr:uncharacterized protein LOC104904709 isoform X4 [Beta vulgaris subsp. vulgaris]
MNFSSSRALFLRIPTLRFTNSYVLLNSGAQFQGYRYYHGLSYSSRQSLSKGICCSMGWNKKLKTVNPVWRPIATQSTSNQDCSVENTMAEPENIGSIGRGDREKCIVSVVREIADSTISSSSRQAENEVDEAPGVEVNPSISGEIGLKDAEGIIRDCTSSGLQSSIGVTDAEKVSVVYKEKHAVSFEVGASVMRFIIGKGKSVQKGIEEEMGVKLIFPSSRRDDSVVIEGESMDVITKTSEKIQAIVDEAVNSSALNYSHFISLPLAIHYELVDKLTRFQSTILGDGDLKDADGTMDVGLSDGTSEDEEVKDKPEEVPEVSIKLKVDDSNNVKVNMGIPLVSYAPKTSKPPTSSDLGIDKSIFIKPKTFHLTVLMLKLWNKERINAAKEVLQSVSSELIEVLDNRPLFVRLKGLECLRGSRAKAQVLYAPVEEIGNEGRLPRACQIITDAFVKAGLVLEKDVGQKLKENEKKRYL